MTRVREALPGDAEGIYNVSVRNAFPSLTADELRKSWASHPFSSEFVGVPRAWVLETPEGEIVGALQNVLMMYELDGVRLKSASAGSWCVDVPHRGFSMFLMMTYFNQEAVDLWLIGTASNTTSRLMSAMKVERIPSPNFDLSYFWITDRKSFLEAALRKKKFPMAGALSRVGAAGLWTLDLPAKFSRRKASAVKRLEGFGPEFDQLWERLRRGASRLRAVRTAAALQWRFGDGLRQGRAVLYGAMSGDELAGYIVLREFVRPHLGLRQFVIADLQAVDDDPDVVIQLVSEAIEASREAGMAALEWQGWNAAKRELALSRRPRPYRYPVWPAYYKAVGAELSANLAKADVWDFSPFDAF
jgi:hypothetical protein